MFGANVNTSWHTLWPLALAFGAQPGLGQSLVYVEHGVAACPAPPVATAAKAVQQGAAVLGRLRVSCGFAEGSYTVTLNSSDPGATIFPKTMLINFGRVVGKGTYTVRFSSLGLQRVSAAITPNMGSPAVPGYFAGAGNEFQVVPP
jgi:hypothetical protein